MRAAGRHRKPSELIPVICAVAVDSVIILVGVGAGLPPLAAGTLAAVTAILTLVAIRGGTRIHHGRQRARAHHQTVAAQAATPGERAERAENLPAGLLEASQLPSSLDAVSADVVASVSLEAASLDAVSRNAVSVGAVSVGAVSVGAVAAPPDHEWLPLPSGSAAWPPPTEPDAWLASSASSRPPAATAARQRPALLAEASALLAHLRWEYGVRHRSRVWIEDVLPAHGARFSDELVAVDVLAACALNAGALDADLRIIETTAPSDAIDVAAGQICVALTHLGAELGAARTHVATG